MAASMSYGCRVRSNTSNIMSAFEEEHYRGDSFAIDREQQSRRDKKAKLCVLDCDIIMKQRGYNDAAQLMEEEDYDRGDAFVTDPEGCTKLKKEAELWTLNRDLILKQQVYDEATMVFGKEVLSAMKDSIDLQQKDYNNAAKLLEEEDYDRGDAFATDLEGCVKLKREAELWALNREIVLKQREFDQPRRSSFKK